LSPLPITARRDGSSVNSFRSAARRSAGTAQISEWVTPFTSSHQSVPLALAPARSATVSSSGTMRSDFT
jgi:hypothetical protein